jgi:hypothetical protein
VNCGHRAAVLRRQQFAPRAWRAGGGAGRRNRSANETVARAAISGDSIRARSATGESRCQMFDRALICDASAERPSPYQREY